MRKKPCHQIAIEVAASAGLKLVWQASDQFYDRVDQKDESDLYFLKRLCIGRGQLRQDRGSEASSLRG
jgi:phage protein D